MGTSGSVNRLRARCVALSALLAGLPATAMADWALNFQRPVSAIAQEQFDLHMLIFQICVVIFIGVFAVMFYSLYAHRKSKGHKAATFSHSTSAEVVWTIIPALILVFMAVPSTKALLMMEDTTESDITLKVTGYQWRWHYDYMDYGVDFYSTLSTPRDQIENREEKGEHYLLEVDRHVVLPINKKVRLLLTANDVIHAWWVPQVAGKKDAIPGFINEMWFNIDEPGVYRGQCAELCGKDHGYMPIVVEAVTQEEFDAWVKEQGGQMPAEPTAGNTTGQPADTQS